MNSRLTSSFHNLIAQSFESVYSKRESHAIINLRTERDGTGECKVLIIDHNNIIPTSCTFLMDQFLTITSVWGHVITLPSDRVYHTTLQESSYLYTKFYKILVCSI